MSRRYGRQQKRRAQQRIANLEREVAELRALGAENREIVARTARVLGSDLISFEPPALDVPRTSDHRIPERIRVLQRSMAARAHLGDPFVPIQDLCETTHHIETLQLSGWGVDVHRAMHFRLQYAGETIGYAVSPEALADDLTGNFVEQHIARCLAEQIRRVLIERTRRVPT